MENNTTINSVDNETFFKYKKVHDHIKKYYPLLYDQIINDKTKNKNNDFYFENIVLASDCGR